VHAVPFQTVPRVQFRGEVDVVDEAVDEVVGEVVVDVIGEVVDGEEVTKDEVEAVLVDGELDVDVVAVRLLVLDDIVELVVVPTVL
jgi:hypothetical protein